MRLTNRRSRLPRQARLVRGTIRAFLRAAHLNVAKLKPTLLLLVLGVTLAAGCSQYSSLDVFGPVAPDLFRIVDYNGRTETVLLSHRVVDACFGFFLTPQGFGDRTLWIPHFRL